MNGGGGGGGGGGGRGGRKGKNGAEHDSRFDSRYDGQYDNVSVSSSSFRTQDRTADRASSVNPQDNSLFHGDPYASASDPYYSGGGNIGPVGGGRRSGRGKDEDDMSVASQDLSSVSSACR